MTDEEIVRKALKEWGTDWYGPNPAYAPAAENAKLAVSAFERILDRLREREA